MTKTDANSLAAVEFQLRWKSEDGEHTECLHAGKVNFWRDILPKPLLEKLVDRSVGDSVKHSFGVGEGLPALDPSKRFRVRRSQFDEGFRPEALTHPRPGRFYPKGILKGVANVFKANMEPFRCAEVAESEILVDFGHPLAGKELVVQVTLREIMDKTAVRSGPCTDWMEVLTAGPGMQARWNGQPTDFFSDDPFGRSDEQPDGMFYDTPRFVNHLDGAALGVVRGLHGQLLRDGDRVLDLMSSWTSHLPPGLSFGSVTGLGLNAEELARNERLTRAMVHDLNENPALPFEDGSFDAVLCTVSVEYLTQPLEVFREVGRVLRPGGCFAVTFSNRWFPPKAVNVWQQLHEYERLGLVSEYFLRSGPFGGVTTHSVRGLPRPQDDKYFGEVPTSDPVYGVWAYRR